MKHPRWVFDAHSLIGPGFVHVNIGVRATFADHAVALFVGLAFVELMVQYTWKDPL